MPPLNHKTQAASRRADIFTALRDEHGWQQKYTNPFYERILEAGFNRSTIRQAFVLATIVEELGPISVRGAFYRGVSAGIFPGTDECHYRAACNIILKLRRRECIRYSQIVDSTRRTLKPSSWSGLADFLDSAAQAYRKDLWGRQRDYLELFVEKDAMAGVLEPITEEYDVSLRIIRGDISETFAWSIAEDWNKIQKPITAYYFGDHDPSGLRIENTLKEKLAGFCNLDFAWKRLAITEADFFDTDILGFTIKGDRGSKSWQTKHRDYLRRFGDRCVEVDALHPAVIRDRVKLTIERHIDQGEWQKLQAVETLERNTFKEFVVAQKVSPGGERHE